MDSSTPQFGASSSSSSSSSSTHSFIYDVFLSFRGEDTRNNFTGHLYNNLVQNRINTFIDNDLTRGEDMKKELLQVIEGSRISIVVLSANYAHSKWCLDELVKILQCKESKQQIVYPIFYKVEPSEIRYQRGSFGEGIAHLSRYKDNLEKVESWKAALHQAADFSGWPISEGGHEATVIDEIVRKISTKIMKYTSLHVATYPVGIESRVEDILKLLNVAEDDPQMIGIWGIGGIGKTTLATAVYNSISHKFEHSCFLENIREKSSSNEGLVKLQNNFLSRIIERNIPPTVTNVAEGISVLKQKLISKRVLLILDDVDCLDQLRKLAGGCDWFSPRSRVIITTRDKNCLEAHNVNTIYDAKELDDQEALKLFNFHAFKGNIHRDDFSDLATSVVRYAQGNPLALEVLGSDLCGKSKDEWKDGLEYYRKYPNQKVQQILQRSYEALEDPMKEVFLHIACFFKHFEPSYVRTALQSCDLNPTFALKVLVEKALIKIQKHKSYISGKICSIIWIHDLVEDMGKEIVRRESPNEPGQRSRLWRYEDVCQVLEENTGTDKIIGIKLDMLAENQQNIRLNGRSFTNMKNLQILILFSAGSFQEEERVDVDHLPNQLRVFDWMDASFRSLPTNFNPRKLGMLHMQGPCTMPLVNQGFKNTPVLKSIQLSECQGLKRIPDLSGLTSLEHLYLFECNNLVEVHPSVGRHQKLADLTITFCSSLKMFLERINMKSLQTLNISFCPLQFFPEIEGDMKSLKNLNLAGTAIKELPCSVGNLTGLKSLSLYLCRFLTTVPFRIFYELQRLEDLDLRLCHNLVTFPTPSGSLPPPKPVFSTNLTRLRVRLNRCQLRLGEISEFPLQIHSLDVTECWKPERMSKLSKYAKMMARVELTHCRKLCDNLAREVVSVVAVDELLSHAAAKKRKRMPSSEELMGEEEELTALLLFFSCAPIPNWLTCRQDIQSFRDDAHEFLIRISQNLDWDNIRVGSPH